MSEPGTCPRCGSAVKKLEHGALHQCTNPDCELVLKPAEGKHTTVRREKR